MKKWIAFFLACVMCCGLFTACGNNEEVTPTTTETPVTPDDGVLRVLLLGHSLGNDSVWMLPGIAQKEGCKDMVFGMLYHSGCRLKQHVQYAAADAPEYNYRQYDINVDTTWQIADANGNYQNGGTNADLSGVDTDVTMRFAIEQQDWDLVVLQGGVFEQSGDTSDCRLDTSLIQALMTYVINNDIDRTTVPEFCWNQTWGCPEELERNKGTYRNHLMSKYANSQEMFEAICSTLRDKIAAEYEFEHIFYTGTAFWNAHSSYLGDEGMYRDYIHATDFGRVVAAYTWLCTLTGKDMSQMQIPPVGYVHLKDSFKQLAKLDYELTEAERNLLIESVTNALKNPYELTQSAYTEAPAA